MSKCDRSSRLRYQPKNEITAGAILATDSHIICNCSVEKKSQSPSEWMGWDKGDYEVLFNKSAQATCDELLLEKQFTI
jgi:hypothetical protein